MSIESILGATAILIALIIFYLIIKRWAESKAALQQDSEEESETINFPIA